MGWDIRRRKELRHLNALTSEHTIVDYTISDHTMAGAKKKVSKTKKGVIKPVVQEYQQNLKMTWVKMVEQRKKEKERVRKQMQRKKKAEESAAKKASAQATTTKKGANKKYM